MRKPKQRKPNDLSRSLAALDVDHTLIAVVEMSLSSWLVAGIVPGVERQPLKKLKTDACALLELLHRWRAEAVRAGHKITRIAVAFEAGRDGFWLARWLKARGIEAHVIHASSIAVSREHRRAKTDRLDTDLLKRSFLGWLRGERDHCKTVAIPTLEEEDAKRPNRERESLVGEQSRLVNRMKATLVRLGIQGFNPKLKRAAGDLEALRTPEGAPIPPNTLAELKRDMERRRFICDQIRKIEQARIERLDRSPNTGPNAMVRLLARVIGIGIETADLLVHEVLLRDLRDRRAVARYGGLTGSPDRSGTISREKGIARSGQCPRAARHGPAGLAVPAVPEGQRSGAMVSPAHGECAAIPQDYDRGSGPQATDRAVATGARGRDPGGHRHAPRLMEAACPPVCLSPDSFGSIRTVVTGCR